MGRQYDNYRKTTKSTSKVNEEKKIRLNKFISNSGVCERRQADELIKNGDISVNGSVVTEMGILVALTDKVVYEGKTLNPEKRVYILLNKPKNFTTDEKDQKCKRSVLDLVKHACTERVSPVGELGNMSLGVLLITNDDELSNELIDSDTKKKKIYHVFLDKAIKEEHIKEIEKGVELRDGFIRMEGCSSINKSDTELGIETTSSKNRIVQRVLEHLGYEVKKIDRTYFCGLTKKNVQRGEWRHLTNKEVKYLKAGLLG